MVWFPQEIISIVDMLEGDKNARDYLGQSDYQYLAG